MAATGLSEATPALEGSTGAVCVTGGLGFIGSRVCALLAERGHEVVCVDRLSGTYAGGTGDSAAAMLACLPGVRVVRDDLATADLDRVLGGAAAVLHLAARPGVRSDRPLGDYWRDNTLLTERIVAHAAARGARVVLASSSSVYGDAVRHPTPEHAPPSPLSPYAVSKLAAEGVCASAACAGADVVIARLFTVFGPNQRPDMAFARWIEAIARGKPIAWQVPPRGARELTYVDDAARGLIAVLEHGRPGQAYNVAGTGSYPLQTVLDLLEAELGRAARVVRRPPTALDPVRTEACRVKSTLELGYRPLTPLAEGLRRQVEAAAAPLSPAASVAA